MWANDYYASEVHNIAIPSMTGAMATKAAKVAEVPSYQWMDRNVTVDTLFSGTLAQIRAANKAGASPPYAGYVAPENLPEPSPAPSLLSFLTFAIVFSLSMISRIVIALLPPPTASGRSPTAVLRTTRPTSTGSVS